jgi:CHASE3 domain sensor protein
MNDDRMVRLLEEMRDLQRQHVDSYREALLNQAESIKLQQEAMKRVRMILVLAGVGLVLVLVVLFRVLARAPHFIR